MFSNDQLPEYLFDEILQGYTKRHCFILDFDLFSEVNKLQSYSITCSKFLKPATHLAIIFADRREFDRQRKSQAIFATDRMRTHLAIFFANRGNVALQPCSQAPSAAAIHHFKKIM